MVSIMAVHRLSLVLLVLSFVLMLSAVQWPVPMYHLLVLLVLLAALVIRHAAIRRATHAMLPHRPLSATITRITRVTRVARIKIDVAITTMTAILPVATTALRPLPLPLPLSLVATCTSIVFSPARFSILAVAVAVAAASLVVEVLVVAVRELISMMMSVVGFVAHLVSGLCEPVV